MKATDALDAARDAMTVKRVFAEPYQQDGVTVIAAANVNGGAGGGSGTTKEGQPSEGGGFGLRARPAGAYVIKDGHVKWHPAYDPQRIIAVVGLIIVVFLFRRRRSVPQSGS